MSRLILKQCQVCGKTISADNGNLETEICNVCEERRKLESNKKALLLKNNEKRKKKKSRKIEANMEKLTNFVA